MGFDVVGEFKIVGWNDDMAAEAAKPREDLGIAWFSVGVNRDFHHKLLLLNHKVLRSQDGFTVYNMLSRLNIYIGEPTWRTSRLKEGWLERVERFRRGPRMRLAWVTWAVFLVIPFFLFLSVVWILGMREEVTPPIRQHAWFLGASIYLLVAVPLSFFCAGMCSRRTGRDNRSPEEISLWNAGRLGGIGVRGNFRPAGMFRGSIAAAEFAAGPGGVHVLRDPLAQRPGDGRAYREIGRSREV